MMGKPTKYSPKAVQDFWTRGAEHADEWIREAREHMHSGISPGCIVVSAHEFLVHGLYKVLGGGAGGLEVIGEIPDLIRLFLSKFDLSAVAYPQLRMDWGDALAGFTTGWLAHGQGDESFLKIARYLALHDLELCAQWIPRTLYDVVEAYLLAHGVTPVRWNPDSGLPERMRFEEPLYDACYAFTELAEVCLLAGDPGAGVEALDLAGQLYHHRAWAQHLVHERDLPPRWWTQDGWMQKANVSWHEVWARTQILRWMGAAASDRSLRAEGDAALMAFIRKHPMHDLQGMRTATNSDPLSDEDAVALSCLRAQYLRSFQHPVRAVAATVRDPFLAPSPAAL